MNIDILSNADKRIKEIISRLEKYANESVFKGKVYLVGGCVRDLILEKPISDIDIVIEQENGGVDFSAYVTAKENCYMQDKNPCFFPKYGTASFRFANDDDLSKISIECVMSKKNHSSKEFGTIKEDMENRDFTINSLCYNITEHMLLDYNKTALDDLYHMVIRTPLDSTITFTADPLRIMRGIRIASQYGMGIDSNTWLGMIKCSYMLQNVAQERITSELSKILLTEKPSIGVERMKNCGVLDIIIPDIYSLIHGNMDKSNGNNLYDFMLKVLDNTNQTIESRLAALFHNTAKLVQDKDIPSITDNFSAEVAIDDLKTLKYPSNVIDKVSKAIRYHRGFSSCVGVPQDKKIRKFINLTDGALSEAFMLMFAYNMADKNCKDKNRVLDILSHIEKMKEKEDLDKVSLPINGNDIMKEFNIKGGPTIGILLNAVKEKYFENPSITKDECFSIVENKLRELTI